jgi:hypothetical protein
MPESDHSTQGVSVVESLAHWAPLWNINSAIKMAERVVELEEEGLEDLIDTKGDVVPSEWARIHEIETVPATIDGHRSELVTFKRKKGGKGNHW